MTTQLYGLDVPDETNELGVKDADPKELFWTAYKAYLDIMNSGRKFGSYEEMYWRACRMTRPYADTLSVMLKEKRPFCTGNCDRIDENDGLAGYMEGTYAGLFLSSVISQSSAKMVICGIETKRLGMLASFLPKDKIFINCGTGGDYMGLCSEGMIINCGEVGNHMGEEASGAVINCGETDDFMGEYASGPVINYGKTGGSMGDDSKGLIVNYGEAGNAAGYNAKGIVINCGTTGNGMGEWAKCPVINYDKTGFWLGQESDGIIVNCGNAEKKMGDAAKGTILALKSPASFGNLSKAKTIVRRKNWKECRGQELAEYFDKLKTVLDEGKNDYTVLSKLPNGKKVRNDVETILKARGYLKD